MSRLDAAQGARLVALLQKMGDGPVELGDAFPLTDDECAEVLELAAIHDEKLIKDALDRALEEEAVNADCPVDVLLDRFKKMVGGTKQ